MSNMIRISSLFALLALCVLLAGTGVEAQTISYGTAGSSYTQNYDGLPSTGTFTYTDLGVRALSDPPILATGLSGWYFVKNTGTGTVDLFTVDNGGATSGGVKSFGTTGASDRALGGLGSGTYAGRWGALITNNTGTTLNKFTITYTGEQWRANNVSAQSITFDYKVGATTINDVGFVSASTLDFTSPNLTTLLAIDGNASGNRTAITATIFGLTWANGTVLAIRWTDANDAGNDHALAVDDLTFSADIQASTNYYYKGTGGLHSVASWGSNPDGSGASPTDFTSDNQVFNTRNTTAVSTSAPWTVSGAGSKVVLGNSSDAAITLTVASGSPLSGLIDVSSSSAGSNTLVLQDGTTPGIGSLDASSTVVYDASVGQSVAVTTFGNLTLSNSGTKTFGGNTTTVAGNLVLSNTTIDAPSVGPFATISLGGNITYLGTVVNPVDGNSITLMTTGTGTQTITGNGNTARFFRVQTNNAGNNVVLSSAGGTTNLTVANTSGGGITLATATTLTLNSNTLTFFNGIPIITGTGTITCSPTSNIIINANSASSFGSLTLTAGSETLNNLTVNMTGTGDSVRLGSDVIVGGVLGLTAGKLSIVTHTLTINGSVSVASGVLVGGATSNITVGGTSASTSLPSVALSALTLNRGNGISLGGNVTVGGTLTLTSGNITTGANTLNISTGGSVSRTGGHVVGSLQRGIAAGASTVVFDVGDAANYSPATVVFDATTTAGSLTVAAVADVHPNFASSSISQSKYVRRYWSFGSSDITGTYDATLQFVASDIQGGANYQQFILGKYSSGWTYPTVGSRTSTTTQATGVTTFGDFAIGEPATGPTINVTGGPFAFGAIVTGSFSPAQAFSVSGANLTANITITAPTGFQISTVPDPGFTPTNPIVLTQTGGTVPPTSIYARFAPATLGSASSNIALTSTGATPQNVGVSGTGVASAPTTQCSITFGTVGYNTLVVNFSGGNGAKRILLARSGAAVADVPADGSTYTGNSDFSLAPSLGASKVILAGTGSTVTVTGLGSGVTYYFAIFEYNDGGVAGGENYLTDNPGTGNQTTLQLAYYSQGSLPATTLTSWNTARNGSGSPPSDFASGGRFVIQNTHIMPTNGVIWALTGSGSAIEIESGGRLDADDSVSVENFQVDNGGTYNNNYEATSTNGTAANFPGSLSRTLGPSSSVIISKWAKSTSQSPAALPLIEYGNLTINVPTWAGSINLQVPAAGTFTVHGNLVLQSTGGTTREFRVSNNDGVTLQVDGNFEITGGRFDFTNSSTSTNTWTMNVGGNINFSSGTWDLNAGTLTVNFTGGAATVSSSFLGAFTTSAVNGTNWVVGSGKSLTLLSDQRIGTGRTFTLNGPVTMPNSSDTLYVDGSLAETAGNTVGGRVQTTRDVAATSTETFGGIGLELTTTATPPGPTAVTRVTGMASPGAGTGSILRYFDVTPTVNTGLNVTLVFRYDDSELNSLTESNLVLFKSTDAGATWSSGGGAVNTTDNTLTLTGVNELSRWTAGVSGSTTVIATFLLRAGWDMVSLPVRDPVGGSTVPARFPTSTYPRGSGGNRRPAWYRDTSRRIS